MPKVFISYSHDSPEHQQWVLQVSEQLRAGGLECQIDRYVKGSPHEGWPSWMEKQIEQADYVLIVCSPLYLKRYRREDTEGGRGVAFEGLIITQTLYDHYCHNKKFIPVIPAAHSIDHVPLPLKSFTAYHLPGDYDLLYRLLTDQPAVVPGAVGSIKIMPPESAPQSIHTTTADHPPSALSPQTTPSGLPPPSPKATYDPSNAAFLVPFRAKGNYMVGRDKALEKVRQQLLAGKPTSIGQTALFQGMGGLGKTQLAVEYAHQYRSEYPNGVYWITADENIDAQLTQIAVDARWIAPASEHATKLDIARHRLKTYSDCLIVFDNLKSVDAIRDYLPEPSATPHILVTSRSEQPKFTDVKLELLDDEQSYLMLVQEAERTPANEEEKSAAREIAAAFSGLPLALELAGAYLAHRPIGWCAYRDLLRDDLKQALPTRLASLTEHEADLFKTLRVSEREISEEPLLAEVLDLLTWSGSSPMSLRLMAHLLNVQPTQLYGALGLGEALRLLQSVPDSERYAIHRLVQEVRRQDRPLAQRNDWANAIAQRLGDWFEAIRKDFRELPVFELEFEHLRVWQVNAELFSPVTSVRLLWLQAYPAYRRGRYDEALRIVQQALAEYEAHDFSHTLLKANLLNDLASCHASLGDCPRALELSKQALEMRCEILGDKHPDVAASLNSLAAFHSELGDHPRALELGKQAFEMLRELLGEKHPDVANSLSNLAAFHSKLGDYPRALELGKQALEMLRELLGEKHPDVANSLSNLASFHAELREYPIALELGKQALEMLRELLGEKHPDVATSLSNLAAFHLEFREPSRALDLGEQALEMRRELLGDKHPDVANSLHNLANVHARLGDHPRALELGKHALEMRRELLGESHPATIHSLQFVAERLYRNPFTAGAGKALVEEFMRHIPREHPSHAKVLRFLDSRDGFRKQGKTGHGKKQKKRR